MRLFVAVALLCVLSHAEEKIVPSQFKVELIQRCEVLGLSKAPNRKAEKKYSHGHTGSCVQNFGCIREITQKELDTEHDKTKRDF